MTAVNPLSATTVPALPTTAGIKDPVVANFLNKLKDIINVREGISGDPLDADVTFRDLYHNGMLQLDKTGTPYVRLPGTAIAALPLQSTTSDEFFPPPAITGLAVNSGLAMNIVSFDQPQYWNHAYTEVWRADTNDLSSATRVGTTPGSVYADNVGDTNLTKYYWVRAVSTSGVIGPWNGTNGTASTTAQVLGTNIAAGTITGDKIYAGTITGSNIATDTLTAANIAANTIDATRLSITTLSAITADMGSITSGSITLDTNGFIAGGQTGFNTGTGFYLGYSGGEYVFSIGDPSGDYIAYDGTTLTIGGSIIASGNIQAGSIQTTHLAANAVSTLQHAAGTGSISLSSGPVTSVTITTEGGAVLLVSTLTMIQGSTAGQMSATLNNGATALVDGWQYTIGGQYASVSLTYIDNPAAGTYTYYLYGGSSYPGATAYSWSLSAVELKR